MDGVTIMEAISLFFIMMGLGLAMALMFGP